MRSEARNRASLDLELALIISLLVLVAVASLGWMGSGIANQYTAGATAVEVANYTSPTAGGSTDNGDGSHDIGWSGGEPPFDIIRSDAPDMTAPEDIGTTPEQSYTVLPEPGENFYQIIDGDGRSLPSPILITLPLTCYDHQDRLREAVAAYVANGGDISILDSRLANRALLVPLHISADHYDDATTCPDDGAFLSAVDGEYICPNHLPLD